MSISCHERHLKLIIFLLDLKMSLFSIFVITFVDIGFFFFSKVKVSLHFLLVLVASGENLTIIHYDPLCNV